MYFFPTVYVHACVNECTHVSLHSPRSTHAVELLRRSEDNLLELDLLLDWIRLRPPHSAVGAFTRYPSLWSQIHFSFQHHPTSAKVLGHVLFLPPNYLIPNGVSSTPYQAQLSIRVMCSWYRLSPPVA